MKPFEWLVGEIEGWVRRGLLDEATAARILQSYREAGAGEERRSPARMMFALAGVFLVGLGVILLIGHNWADLTRVQRTVLSFLPLVLGQALASWVWFRRMDQAVWREGAATAVMLAIGASIALISQTYHIPGEFDRFMLVWMILTLPLIYLFRATTPAIACLVGINVWAGYLRGEGDTNLYSAWLILAALMPHVVEVLRRDTPHLRAVWLSWAVASGFSVLFGITLPYHLRGGYLLLFAALFALYYGGDRLFLSPSLAAWRRPFYLMGACGLLTIGLWSTWLGWWSHEVGLHLARGPVHVEAALMFAGIGAVIVAGVILFRRRAYSALYLMGIPLALAIAYGVALGTHTDVPAMVLMNLTLLVVGVSSMLDGIRGGRLGKANAGMLVVAVLVAFRFFDADLSILARGIVFILLGVGFIAMNLMATRKKEGK